jgi:deoxyribonuclease-4
MHLAVAEALRLGLECVQVFTKNQQQWRVPALGQGAIEAWRGAVRDAGWQGVSPPRLVSHASYLINLASPDAGLRAKSIELMGEELRRCEVLGIPLLVFHPGAYTTSTRADGHARLADACAQLLTDAQARSGRTVLCLENVVGAGTTIGGTFDELAAVREMILTRLGSTGQGPQVGFCIDTCHAYAAGFDCASPEASLATIETMLSTLGRGNVRCLHVNDSLTPLGSRRDRHAPIGEGTIGLAGFAPWMTHEGLAGLMRIMETPKGRVGGEKSDGEDFDAINARRLRSLLGWRAGEVPPSAAVSGDFGPRMLAGAGLAKGTPKAKPSGATSRRKIAPGGRAKTTVAKVTAPKATKKTAPKGDAAKPRRAR